MKMSTGMAAAIVLIVVSAVLFVAALFFSVLLIPAIVAGVVGIMIAIGATPEAMLVAAWLFTALAGVGFVILALTWGKLEYGLLGYLIVWGPFIAALCAAGLFAAHGRGR